MALHSLGSWFRPLAGGTFLDGDPSVNYPDKEALLFEVCSGPLRRLWSAYPSAPNPIVAGNDQIL
jgi:hypothetical protein